MTNSNAHDVIIVGAGPVGLTLANLLGTYGVRTLVLERNATLEPEPRAVTLDDESLRTMQSAGLVDQVLRDVVLGYGVEYFDWRGKPFASIQPTRQEYGYPKRNAFRQPLLVRTLFDGLKRFPHVEVRFGDAFESLAQHGEGVSVKVARDEERYEANGQWLVACDGGRSPVREFCRIVLDGETYAERWLIVDLRGRTVPLRHTRTYCDPRRPAIRLPGPHGSLRYEFMLRPGDVDQQVLDEAVFRDWIARRVPEDRDLPLVRKAIYGFHARVATRWREGRVLFAGDAAHLTPPFAGQGLNSGIRDAANLAWKLAEILNGRQSESLIETYEMERRPHAASLIRMALRIGTVMQPKTLLGAALTQTALRAAFLIPACRDYILQLRFKPKPRFAQGFFCSSGRFMASELLPQPAVQHGISEVMLDDVLGSGYAVIGWSEIDVRLAAEPFLRSGAQVALVQLVRREDDFVGGSKSPDVLLVRDVSGEIGHLLERLAAAAVVVRPDRYLHSIVSLDTAPRAELSQPSYP
jgi:3-(3-hydroxy-phenyl)propionate hydroxylase